MAAPATLAFSLDEFARRVSATRQAMAQREIDVYLVDQQEHVAYLTGYFPPATRYQCLLLPLEGEPLLHIRPLDEYKVNGQSWTQNYVIYQETDDSIVALVNLMKSQGWGSARIGMEKDQVTLSVANYEKLVSLLPDATFVDVSGIMAPITVIKSGEEIEYHRKAAAICDAAALASMEAVWAGGTLQDARIAATSVTLQMGGDEQRASMMRLEPPKETAPGEDARLFFVEMLPQYKGYGSRNIRAATVGQASDAQREATHVISEIQDDMFAAMVPGARACDVDAICRERILASGLRPSYASVTGHALGYGTPGRPTDLTWAFLPDSEWELREGMVFHVYTTAKGLGLGETILVTPNGGERLTTLERKLFER